MNSTLKFLISLISIVLIVLLLVFKPWKSEQRKPIVQSILTPEKPLPNWVTGYLDFIEQELDSNWNVGAAITIVQNNEVLVTQTYGYRKVGNPEKVDEHTVFRIASVSKGFAGVLGCLLEQDSIFSLNDRVVEYLPGFRLKDTLNTDSVTIRNTLSHTSGLVPHAFDNLIEDGVPLGKIIEQLAYADISAPPGLLYSYQNVIFSLIDTIVRTSSGEPYSELLEQKIFKPLHMKNASATAEIFEKKKSNVAYPHARIDSGYRSLPLNLGYYNIAPAAGVNVSISDMSKWLLALLGNNPDVLDSSVLHEIYEPVVVSPLKRRYTRYWDKIDEKYYGLGWRIYMYKGRKIIYHGGYVKGYRAEIGFCPEENIGMVFLQNSPNRVASICVPAFFDTWFAQKDSLSTDTIKKSFELRYSFLDDSVE